MWPDFLHCWKSFWLESFEISGCHSLMEASLAAVMKASCPTLEINVRTTFPFRLLFRRLWSVPLGCLGLILALFFEVFTFSFLPPEILISKNFSCCFSAPYCCCSSSCYRHAFPPLWRREFSVHLRVTDMPSLLSGDGNLVFQSSSWWFLLSCYLGVCSFMLEASTSYQVALDQDKTTAGTAGSRVEKENLHPATRCNQENLKITPGGRSWFLPLWVQRSWKASRSVIMQVKI